MPASTRTEKCSEREQVKEFKTKIFLHPDAVSCKKTIEYRVTYINLSSKVCVELFVDSVSQVKVHYSISQQLN